MNALFTNERLYYILTTVAWIIAIVALVIS